MSGVFLHESRTQSHQRAGHAETVDDAGVHTSRTVAAGHTVPSTPRSRTRGLQTGTQSASSVEAPVCCMLLGQPPESQRLPPNVASLRWLSSRPVYSGSTYFLH